MFTKNFYKEIEKEVNQVEKIKCGKVEACLVAGNDKHIEVEVLYSTETSQEARDIVQRILNEKFPKNKFRLCLMKN